MQPVVSRESTAIVGALTMFVEAWTQPLFDAAEHAVMCSVFSRLVRMVFDEGGDARLASPQRSQLCADGTPVEFSLSLDSLRRFAVRYVCDLTNTAVPTESLNPALRSAADIVVPSEWESAAVLNRLFQEYLAAAPLANRFRAWHGAGFAPGGHRVGKLYFNALWLDASQVHAILAATVPGDQLRFLAALGYERYAGVGYDFDSAGITKVKAYVRSTAFDEADILGRSDAFLPRRSASFKELTHCLTGKHRPVDEHHSVFSFGFLPRRAGREVKGYFQLQEWGMPTFASANPLVADVLSRWDIPQSALAASGPAGFAPTLISLGVDDYREIASVYFKPLLPASAL